MKPQKTKHLCASPGCPRLVEYGERFCEEHQREENKRYEKYGRDPVAKKRYGRAWWHMKKPPGKKRP